MLGYVVIGTLAAFGLLCAVWILCGSFMEKPGGQLVYQGGNSRIAVQRYIWLREMGLVRCSIGVLEPDNELIPWLKAQEVEIYSREDIQRLFGIGAKEN